MVQSYWLFLCFLNEFYKPLFVLKELFWTKGSGVVMKKLANHIPQDSCKPQIDYPCVWQYKLIGRDRNALLDAVNHCVKESPVSITDSNASSSGKFISISLEVTVPDEQRRLQIYRELAEHSAVKVVL